MSAFLIYNVLSTIQRVLVQEFLKRRPFATEREKVIRRMRLICSLAAYLRALDIIVESNGVEALYVPASLEESLALLKAYGFDIPASVALSPLRRETPR